MTVTADISRVTRTEDSVYFPKVILIDNTNRCNLRCAMCIHQDLTTHRKSQSMEMSLFKKIIDEIAAERPTARVWMIFCGEPCLAKDMPERIAYAKNKGLTDVVLNSNGVLLTPEKAKAFIDAGLDAMYVGIDAATRESYDKVRIGGDFEKAVNNVLAYNDLLLRKGGNQQLFVQMVVLESNAHERDAFVAFWKSKGITTKVRPLGSWAGLKPTPNLRDNATVTRKPCYWLMQGMTICANGDVALCAADMYCRVNLGNVGQSTMKNIWFDAHKKLRDIHKENRWDELPDMCRACPDWQAAYADFV